MSMPTQASELASRDHGGPKAINSSKRVQAQSLTNTGLAEDGRGKKSRSGVSASSGDAFIAQEGMLSSISECWLYFLSAEHKFPGHFEALEVSFYEMQLYNLVQGLC